MNSRRVSRRAEKRQSKKPLQEQKAFITDTWHKAASRGGRDAKEIPVRNWSSFLAIEWKYEQNRKAETDRRSPVKPKAKTEAEILREACQ